jgi:peptidoglycan/xylan/chitin deacetylase (PgdA/CDA1 family)
MKIVAFLLLLVTGFATATADEAKLPIPDKLVVLTFDDSVNSHFAVVRPILKKHGFGATFYITEGFDFKTNKRDYMTWEEIAHLHRDGFEIGNHTRDHMGFTAKNLDRVTQQIEAINNRCREYGIPPTTTLAYPGNAYAVEAFGKLRELGIRFARRGGTPEYPYEKGKGVGYEPGLDHPLLIPSAGDARPFWTLEDFVQAAEQAKHGRVAVLQFHGVPDRAHPWVHSPVKRFREYMQYLADNNYAVIAMRDLAKYVDADITPSDTFGMIKDRQQALAAGGLAENVRRPTGEENLKNWLQNMVWHHRFTTAEIGAATGLSSDEVRDALKRFEVHAENRPPRADDAPLLVLPFPGGRHPRIGFLDGAIRPQRDTKLSIFTPWDETSYVVADIPEAIRRNNEKEHGLLYLAHTHVDTMWTKQGIPLEPVEWERAADGTLTSERRLPNGVIFGTKAKPTASAVQMEMWLTNGSEEPLSELRVQNCIMLKGAPEFALRSDENKVISKPYVACRSALGNRWVITAWVPNSHSWANTSCPCMHSDPNFGDCAPGETKRLKGWLSFYEGSDVEEEFRRIDASGWQEQ